MNEQDASQDNRLIVRTVKITMAAGFVATLVLAVVTGVLGAVFVSVAAVAGGGGLLCSALLCGHSYLVRNASAGSTLKKSGFFRSESSIVVLGLLILAAGMFFLAYGAVMLFFPSASAATESVGERPKGSFALIAVSAACVLVKELFYHITLSSARRIRSYGLKDFAVRHRIDMLPAAFVLLSLFGGFFIAEDWPAGLAVFCIGAFILLTAVSTLKESVLKFKKKSASGKRDAVLIKRVVSVAGVISVESFRLLPFGKSFRADIRIRVDPSLLAVERKVLIEAVRETLEGETQTLCDIQRCVVEINDRK